MLMRSGRPANNRRIVARGLGVLLLMVLALPLHSLANIDDDLKPGGGGTTDILPNVRSQAPGNLDARIVDIPGMDVESARLRVGIWSKRVAHTRQFLLPLVGVGLVAVLGFVGKKIVLPKLEKKFKQYFSGRSLGCCCCCCCPKCDDDEEEENVELVPEQNSTSSTKIQV